MPINASDMALAQRVLGVLPIGQVNVNWNVTNNLIVRDIVCPDDIAIIIHD